MSSAVTRQELFSAIEFFFKCVTAVRTVASRAQWTFTILFQCKTRRESHWNKRESLKRVIYFIFFFYIPESFFRSCITILRGVELKRATLSLSVASRTSVVKREWEMTQMAGTGFARQVQAQAGVENVALRLARWMLIAMDSPRQIFTTASLVERVLMIAIIGLVTREAHMRSTRIPRTACSSDARFTSSDSSR